MPVPLPLDNVSALSSTALAPLPLPLTLVDPRVPCAALSTPLLSKSAASDGESDEHVSCVDEPVEEQLSVKQQQIPPPPSPCASAATVEAPSAPQQLDSSCVSLHSFAQPPTAAAVTAMQGPSFGPFQFSFPRVLLTQF
jgi:hypothetical protein